MLVSEKNSLTAIIEQIVEKYGNERQYLLPVLQEVMAKFGNISEFAQQEIARLMDIHPVEVYGVVTFYSFLRPHEEGRYNVRLCKTISCDLAGKEAIARTIERELNIKFGESSPDKRYTLEYINCMGMCDIGPAMLVNDDVHTHLTPIKVVEVLKNYK
jgi:NADH:ubiquinone oxidoreductase subunit E